MTTGCLAYFLIFLGSRALDVPDEGRYAEVAREMLLTGDFITPRLNGIAFFHKPVLYYWLQAASFSLFGISEWSVRLMPALSGVLGCVLTYIAGTLIYGRRVGLLAMLILASNPLYFLSAHYADMNLEVAVFISGALLCFLAGLKYPLGPGRRNLMWLAYGFAALGVLTKGLIGIVLPMLVIGSWILLTGRWKLLLRMYLPSGLALFLAITLPWYIAVQLRNPSFFNFFFVFQQFTRFTGSGFNNAFPVWFYLPVLLLGFFPWSIPLLCSVRQSVKHILGKTEASDTELFLWLWLLMILAFFSIPESKIVGYILPVLPAPALLCAVFLDRSLDRLDRERWYFQPLNWLALTALLAGIALLVTAVFLSGDQIGLRPYFLALGAELCAGSITIPVLVQGNRRHLAPFTAAVTGALFSVTLLAAARPFSDAAGTRELAQLLRQKIAPGDLVVNYEDYYPDLGIYLQWPQHITVVTNWRDPEIPRHDNWRSEFYFGFQDTEGEEAWMLDKSGFRDRLAGIGQGTSVYLFCAEDMAARIESEFGFQPIEAKNGVALLVR